MIRKQEGAGYAIQRLWGAHHYELINHPAYEPFHI
jgi:hypothetical protein